MKMLEIIVLKSFKNTYEGIGMLSDVLNPSQGFC